MKISSILVNRLIQLACSKTEINFVCYLAKYQLNTGLIVNMYYKDIISALKIHTVTFYRLLHKLSCKGILTYEICEKYGYYNIQLLDNDFSDNDFSVGYINVNKAVFSEDFFGLKASEKYVVLKLLLSNNDRENEIKLSDNSISKYANINSKNIRLINRILKNIKEMKHNGNNVFNVFTQDRRKTRVHFFKVNKYGVSYMEPSEKRFLQYEMFTKYLNKHKINYTTKDVEDLIQMDNQYMWCNNIYKGIVKEICKNYDSVECKVIRKRIDVIANRISEYFMGTNKMEPIY